MPTLQSHLSAPSSSPAIIIPSSKALTISYSRLHSDVSSFQKLLASAGITPESAVSIALPNSYAFIVSFLATSWQRGIAAPLNPGYKQDEFEFYIDDLKSSLVLVPKGAYAENGDAVRAARKFDAAIAECFFDESKGVMLELKEKGKLKPSANTKVEKPQEDDIALVLHTSGTTGRPKAVPLTHRNLATTMGNIVNTYKLTDKDRTMLVMPLFHVHGLLAGFLAPLHSKGSVVVPPKFSAKEFWQDFTTHKANWYTAVPTIHSILLRSPIPNPVPSIRFIRSCSSPLSPKVFEDLERTFKAPVLEAYAMTEAAHQMTSNPLPPGKRTPGSVGLGQGVEVKILDDAGSEVAQGKEGEICIKGANVTKGYLNNAEANAKSFTSSGFFRTGDQGKKDKDGYVIITGRIKELINKGGEKISPVELDDIVSRCPGVAEAVAFAMDDEMYGQVVGMAIVKNEKDEGLTEEKVKKWVGDRAAKFKVPTKVFFTDVMPKTATGKVQRRLVKDEMLKKEEKGKGAKL